MPGRDAPFYVGWQPKAPVELARFVRGVTIALLLVAAVLAFGLAALQRRADDGTFEFGAPRDFTGVIAASDPPRLLVTRPDAKGTSSYLLVAPWKHGAAALVERWRGGSVTMRGTLVWRGPHTLIEIEPGSIAEAGAGTTEPESVAALGRATLRGEIVDSKCFLGVMKPGAGTLHRACAVRCLSGGIPPALRTDQGLVLLLREDGRVPGHEILPFVAEPVQVTGALERHGERMFLRMEPEGPRRLAAGR